MPRRGFLLGALGAGLAPLAGVRPVLASTEAGVRVFQLFRDDDPIGEHRVAATQTSEGLEVAIDIAIAVKFLGITAYRYDHSNRELWADGRLQNLRATTNDDGDADFVNIERQGDRYRVDGSGDSGFVDGDARPTSYWNRDNFESNRWISTQTGRAFDLNFQKTPLADGGERWDVAGELDATLIYDAAGEWRGFEFVGQGTPIRYAQTQAGPDFRELL